MLDRFRLRWPWALWFMVSFGLTAYVLAGAIASHTTEATLTLADGAETDVTLLRLYPDKLRISLGFAKNPGWEERHGRWAISEERKSATRLRFASPGRELRIMASTPGAPQVLYEAMPVGSRSATAVYRDMTPDLAVEPGLWPWRPASEKRLVLAPGLTKVSLRVASVDPTLVGETATIQIEPPLGFKASFPDVSWLWYSLLWPILIPIQLAWALVLVGWSHVRSRSATRRTG
jgi:hypothetical protein